MLYCYRTNLLIYVCLYIKYFPEGVILIIPIYCKNLKDLRRINNYTQAQVAFLLSIRQEQYSKYENGVRELPICLLIKLCILYHVSADYILGLENRLSTTE